MLEILVGRSRPLGLQHRRTEPIIYARQAPPVFDSTIELDELIDVRQRLTVVRRDGPDAQARRTPCRFLACASGYGEFERRRVASQPHDRFVVATYQQVPIQFVCLISPCGDGLTIKVDFSGRPVHVLYDAQPIRELI